MNYKNGAFSLSRWLVGPYWREDTRSYFGFRFDLTADGSRLAIYSVIGFPLTKIQVFDLLTDGNTKECAQVGKDIVSGKGQSTGQYFVYLNPGEGSKILFNVINKMEKENGEFARLCKFDGKQRWAMTFLRLVLSL